MRKGAHLQRIWDQLPKGRRWRIVERAEQLEAEYLTLQELHKSTGPTQAKVSDWLNRPQSNISRLEKSSDMLISTLREYVAAVGGKLNLTVELPDKPPIVLAGLSDLPDNPQADSKKRQDAR